MESSESDIQSKLVKIENTLFYGNGSTPALVTKVSTSEVEIRNLQKELGGLKDDIVAIKTKLDSLQTDMAALITKVGIVVAVLTLIAQTALKLLF